MMHTRVSCDRCGETITANRTEMYVECGPIHGRRPTVDLCLDCMLAFDAWLSSPHAAFSSPPAGPPIAGRTRLATAV